jgi:putative ABC transport system permease protein
MSDTAWLSAAPSRRVASAPVGLIGAIAWRNLWRNKRRTVLSTGAIGFAVALLLFTMSMQAGTYRSMIANTTGLLDGQLQIQRPGFVDDPRIESALDGVAGRLRRVRAVDGVIAAAPRIEAFVLVSAHDHSFGAQLFGVDPRSEAAVSSVPKMTVAGRYLSGGSEAYAGELLARNLGVGIGDELVILGNTPTGGIAALAVTLVGTFSTGTAELDRQLIEIPITTVADGFEMHDAAHAIVVRTTSVARTHAVAEVLRRDAVNGDDVVLEWPLLIPDLEQAIRLDRATGNVMYGVLAAVVTIGVLNGFLMTVFERTREFGMLLAMGMRPRTLVLMLQIEAAALALIGCVVGLAIGVPLVLWLGHVGIPLGDAGAAMRAFHVADRLYPTLDGVTALKPIGLMALCTQIAALLPALRVRRIAPVEALRAT